jgi:hypothetical protein
MELYMLQKDVRMYRALYIGILQGFDSAWIAEVDCRLIWMWLIGMSRLNALQFPTYIEALSTSICKKGL